MLLSHLAGWFERRSVFLAGSMTLQCGIGLYSGGVRLCCISTVGGLRSAFFVCHLLSATDLQRQATLNLKPRRLCGQGSYAMYRLSEAFCNLLYMPNWTHGGLLTSPRPFPHLPIPTGLLRANLFLSRYVEDLAKCADARAASCHVPKTTDAYCNLLDISSWPHGSPPHPNPPSTPHRPTSLLRSNLLQIDSVGPRLLSFGCCLSDLHSCVHGCSEKPEIRILLNTNTSHRW